MKSKDMQKVVKTKYENGDDPQKFIVIYPELFRYSQLNYG